MAPFDSGEHTAVSVWQHAVPQWGLGEQDRDRLNPRRKTDAAYTVQKRRSDPRDWRPGAAASHKTKKVVRSRYQDSPLAGRTWTGLPCDRSLAWWRRRTAGKVPVSLCVQAQRLDNRPGAAVLRQSGTSVRRPSDACGLRPLNSQPVVQLLVSLTARVCRPPRQAEHGEDRAPTTQQTPQKRGPHGSPNSDLRRTKHLGHWQWRCAP